MLAEFLEGKRERLVLELLARVPEGTAAPGRPASERRERLTRWLDDLMEALRRGGVQSRRRGLVPRDCIEGDAVRERELLRECVIAAIERQRVEVSLREMVVLADWFCAAERDALREHGRQFAAMLDAVNDVVALISPEERILYVNRAAAESVRSATGIAARDMVGKTVAELGMPPDLVRTAKWASAQVRTGRAVTVEMLVPRPDGPRWFEDHLSPVYGDDGAVEAMALISRDIHDRKLAHTRLQLLSKVSMLVGSLEHQEILPAIARLSIPELADWCAVSVVEGDVLRRTYVAQRDPAKAALADQIMRLEREAPPGANPLWKRMLAGRSFLIADYTDEMLRSHACSPEIMAAVEEVGVRSVLVVPLVAEGATVAILTFVTTAESGRRYGPDDQELAEELARRASQIVENARLHQELKSSEARFRVALAGARIAVFEQDTEQRYRWHYNAWIPGDLIGKTHDDWVTDEVDAARLTALKRRVLDEGESVREELELTVCGERCHYRVAVSPLRDDSGAIVGLIGASTDITPEKRAQEELARALTIREQVMGILGHDLRSPLGAVSMAAGLLRRRADLPEEVRDHIERIDRAAERMVEMIETLLDFTRARFRGSLPISPVPTDLAEVSTQVVEELQTAWPERRIALAVHGDVRGEWDPARLAEVVSNLVANALTHGDREEPVAVNVDGEGVQVALTVTNHGPAIPAELMPVLFEPFRRGAVVEGGTPADGLGLGLYIVRQIVLAHDGEITVASTPAEGTTFTVRLPRVRQPLAQVQAAASYHG